MNLKSRGAHLLTRALPLGISVVGAVLLFGATLLARRVLAPVAFGEFSLFLTICSLVAGFGALGLEQVLLRTSRPRLVRGTAVAVVDRQLVTPLVGAALATSIACGLYWGTAVGTGATAVAIAAVAVSVTKVIGSLLRITRRWAASQLVLIAWRLGLAVAVAIAAAGTGGSFQTRVAGPSILIAALVAIGWSRSRSGWRWAMRPLAREKNALMSFGFVGSVGIVTLLGQGERLAIERLFTLQALGDYVFGWTLLVAPLNLLIGYVGFKELVYFRDPARVRSVGPRIASVVIWLSVAYCLMCLTVFASRSPLAGFDLWPAALPKALVWPFAAIVLLRGGYAVLSAVMAARASWRMLFLGNLWSVVAIAAIAGLLVSTPQTLVTIAWFSALAWATRVLAVALELWRHGVFATRA